MAALSGWVSRLYCSLVYGYWVFVFIVFVKNGESRAHIECTRLPGFLVNRPIRSVRPDPPLPWPSP